MTKQQIIKNFLKVVEIVSKDHVSSYFKKHFPEEYAEVINLTSALNEFDIKDNKNKRVSFFERIYCIQHGLATRPFCQHCHTEYVCGFNKQTNEYKKWCSPKCQASDQTCREKSKATRKARYGSETYNGTDKSRQTRTEKNNGSWHALDFSEKIKNTKNARYGDENYVNTDKARSTKKERYGNSNYNNSNKISQTKLKRYGNTHYNNGEKISETLKNLSTKRIAEIAEKRAQTCFEKYGVEFPVQASDVQSKRKNTCIEKYGIDNTLNLPNVRAKAIKRIKEKSWDTITADMEYTPMFTRDEYLENTDQNHVWQWKCSKCGHVFKSTYDNGTHHRCYSCFPNNESGYSILENDLYKYISSISAYPVFNRDFENRHLIAGKEIDIVVPDLRIAFEFDGLYYHSEAVGKNRTYHLNKTENCGKAGYRLIHIFEDEWVFKKKLVMNKIKRILQPARYKIYARKCIVRQIEPSVKNTFLDKYHVQGHDHAGICYGLYYKNRLVAVMTFCKARFDKTHEYELSRYATVNHFSVIGGAGKLLAEFEREYSPKSLVTYADRRWSVGNMYNKLGFRHDHDSPPNYFYVKNQKRYSRQMFQKHKLKDKLDKFDPNKTEIENMKDNGYYRIFDCGNMVFEKIYN